MPRPRLHPHSIGRYAVVVGLTGALLWWLTSLPTPLFETHYSAVVRSADGQLLSARTTADGQWRLPPADTLDARYATAALLFEDEYFRYHPGVNPVSLLRAFRQNLLAGRTVSGGSTITMQTVRLVRRGQQRTLAEKLIEAAWATRLELTYSKDEILRLYAAHAPFGGNVVGLEAAAWRYYGRPPEHFSWAEAAALAVLPNAPGVIYPGRSSEAFRRKRDRLLDKLHDRGHLDAAELVLAKAEPLPGKPYPLPNLAPHLLARGLDDTDRIDAGLQRHVTDAIARAHANWSGAGVHNAAALVIDNHTGGALAYVGNTDCTHGEGRGTDVDVVLARRSSGSLLKPFLFARLLDEGEVSTTTLVADIPTLIAGYAPQNFDRGFDGAVPIGEALTRSLNIPFVRLLRAYGVDPFLRDLHAAGFTTLDRSADDYGLSLMLGGGEVSLADVGQSYRGLAQAAIGDDESWVSPEAAYLTLETLTQLERPGDLAAWRSFGGSRRVAWKTGTSFGHRDAWAVGVTPEYTVAVWVGNASGEGKPGLTGVRAAAPLLFDVFDGLGPTTWFDAPVADMAEVFACRASGLQASRDCPTRDTVLLPLRGQRLPVCAYHSTVFVDAAGRRVDAHCADLAAVTPLSAFALPPAWAWYYRREHAEYAGLPEWAAGCNPTDERVMALVYPRGGRTLHLPRALDGERQAVAMELAHAEPGRSVHWYLDGAHVGLTERLHQLPLKPAAGAHRMQWVDDLGRQLSWGFRVE